MQGASSEGTLGDPQRPAPRFLLRFLLSSNDEASFPSISIGAGTMATWGRASSGPPGSTTHLSLAGVRISKIHCTASCAEGSLLRVPTSGHPEGTPALTIKDSSTNGTWIDGVRHRGCSVQMAIGSTLSFPGEPPLPVYTLAEVQAEAGEGRMDASEGSARFEADGAEVSGFAHAPGHGLQDGPPAHPRPPNAAGPHMCAAPSDSQAMSDSPHSRME